MATPTARFVIAFDADTGGISQSKSELDKLRASIESDTKALADMQAAMQRLKGTAEVTRWEALPKDIAKADAEIKKLEKDFASIGVKFEKAAASGQVSSLKGIFEQGLLKSGEIDKAKARLAGLRGEQAALAGTAPVKAFEDLKLASEKLKGTLGGNQVALSRLGGTMGGAGSEVAKAGGGMASLADAAQQVPGPIGSIASKIQQLKALGPAAAVVAIAVAVIALGVVIAKTAWEFGKLIVESADAARSADLLREASAVGSASAKDLEGAMLRVEGKTSAAREAVSGLVGEYSRLRLSLDTIENATSAITVVTQTMGQQAGSTIKGLIDRAVDTKRAWLGAFDLKGTGLAFNDVAKALAKNMKTSVGVAAAALRDGRVKIDDFTRALENAADAGLGEKARRQMLALPIQLERAKKSLGSIFKDINVEPFLEKLHDLLSLLDETSETGKILRENAKIMFQPLVDAAEFVLPLLEGAFYGVMFALLLLENIGLRIALVFKKTFGGSSIFKDLDTFKIGFYLAVGAVGALVGAMAGLALIAAAVVTSILILTAPIWLIAAGVVATIIAVEAAVDAISAAVTDAIEAVGDVDIAAEIENIIDAITDAVKNGAGAVADAFKDLAGAGLKAFKSALGIASPSKVFKAEAKWIPLGAAQGIEEGRPAVARALSTLAEPSSMGGAEAGGALALAGGGGTTNQVNVNYYGAGSRSDAQRFGQWLFDELETLTLAKGRRA